MGWEMAGHARVCKQPENVLPLLELAVARLSNRNFPGVHPHCGSKQVTKGRASFRFR